MDLTPDRAVETLAGRQRGLVTCPQCLRLGLTRGQIHRRVASGRWRVIARGVYLVGPVALDPVGRCLAATFAAGPESVSSYFSGAALWSLQPFPEGEPHTTGGVARARRGGATVHRTRRWEPGMRTVRFGVPVTTLARTIVDLAELSTASHVEFAIRAAERLHGFDRSLVVPIPGRRGTLRLVPPPRLTQGHLEPMLGPLLTRAGLAQPEYNAPWEGLYLDAVWWDAGLVLEIDDWETHRHREAFIKDRRRSRRLQAAGFRAVQATYEDLTRDAPRFLAELRNFGVPLLRAGG